VETVFEVLLPLLPSAVPVEATLAEFWITVPAVVVPGTVVWIVKTFVPVAARPAAVHVTSCPAAEHPAVVPGVENVVPAGSVSDTDKPPVLSEGPLLVTVTV